MNITNELGLPEPLVDAVRNDGYTKGNADFSVTGLIAPPHQRKLMGSMERRLLRMSQRGSGVSLVSQSTQSLKGLLSAVQASIRLNRDFMQTSWVREYQDRWIFTM